MEKELKVITCDKYSCIKLLEILELEKKCVYCGDKITEDNFGGVFPKTKVCCNRILCTIEATGDD
jgi:hypothetical protein